MLEDSEWGPTVVHSAQPQQPTRGASEGSVRTEGDAGHEARVSAAFGSLELSADAPLAEAANDSAARRREAEERLRAMLKASGVKKIGHREALLRALLSPLGCKINRQGHFATSQNP